MFSFINNLAQKPKTSNIIINNDTLIYLTTHLKLSTLFYSNQLSDIFAYEIPTSPETQHLVNVNLKQTNSLNKSQSTITVYNFHSLYAQDRFFIFVTNDLFTTKSKTMKLSYHIDSVTDLFPSANWLEREVAELHGVVFSGKKDLRNLMLQYGDTTSPFQKSFPTVGLKEMYYEPLKDTLIQNPVTLQL